MSATRCESDALLACTNRPDQKKKFKIIIKRFLKNQDGKEKDPRDALPPPPVKCSAAPGRRWVSRRLTSCSSSRMTSHLSTDGFVSGIPPSPPRVRSLPSPVLPPQQARRKGCSTFGGCFSERVFFLFESARRWSVGSGSPSTRRWRRRDAGPCGGGGGRSRRLRQSGRAGQNLRPGGTSLLWVGTRQESGGGGGGGGGGGTERERERERESERERGGRTGEEAERRRRTAGRRRARLGAVRRSRRWGQRAPGAGSEHNPPPPPPCARLHRRAHARRGGAGGGGVRAAFTCCGK